MKKTIIFAALGFFAFSGNIALAAYAPNMDVYEPTNNECRAGDHEVYERGSVEVVASCMDHDAWLEATRPSTQQVGNQVDVPRGTTVRLTNGLTDTCPVWFPMDCVLEPELFDIFL